MTSPRDFRPEQNFFSGGGCRRLLERAAAPASWQAAAMAMAARMAGATHAIRDIDFCSALEDPGVLAEISAASATVFVLADVLHRLADPRPLLAALRQKLRAHPGHRVLAVTPERGPGGDGLPPDPSHARLWTKPEFLRAMEAAGFKVLRSGHLPDEPAGEKTMFCELACTPAHYHRFLHAAGLPPPEPHLVLTTEPPGAASPVGQYLRAAGTPRLILLAGHAESCIPLSDFGGPGAAEPDEFLAAVLQLLFLYDDISLIEYQDTGGIGLRVAQARRAGMIAPHVTVLAYAHGNGIAADAAAGVIDRRRLPKVSAAERLSVELADMVAFPSPARQALYESAGIKPRAVMPPYPANDAEKQQWRETMAGFLSAGGEAARPGDVAILLTNFNGTAEYLADATAGIRAATPRPARLIAVDDGSSDENFLLLVRMTESLDGLAVDIIRHGESRGPAAARNSGLARVKTAYFCAHDNDNIMRRRFLGIACRMLEENQNLAAVTCWMDYFEDGADWRAEAGVRNDYRPLGADLGICMSDNVVGDNFAVYRTAAVRAIGGWDETGRAMWEDWQLFNRLMVAGYDVWTIPLALTLHRNRPGSVSGANSQFGGWLLIARSLPGLPRNQAISLMQSLWHSAPVPPPVDQAELAELRLIANSNAWRLTRRLLSVLEKIFLIRALRRR